MITRERMLAIGMLANIGGPHAGSGCSCNQCLQAEALSELYRDYREVRGREEWALANEVTW